MCKCVIYLPLTLIRVSVYFWKADNLYLSGLWWVLPVLFYTCISFVLTDLKAVCKNIYISWPPLNSSCDKNLSVQIRQKRLTVSNWKVHWSPQCEIPSPHICHKNPAFCHIKAIKIKDIEKKIFQTQWKFKFSPETMAMGRGGGSVSVVWQ